MVLRLIGGGAKAALRCVIGFINGTDDEIVRLPSCWAMARRMVSLMLPVCANEGADGAFDTGRVKRGARLRWGDAAGWDLYDRVPLGAGGAAITGGGGEPAIRALRGRLLGARAAWRA